MQPIYILGISCFYHDSAASLIKDGEIVAAVHEERFTRKKHDPRFPIKSINYCLEEAQIELNAIDSIVYYDNPMITLERIFSNQIATYPEGKVVWNHIVSRWVNTKLRIIEYLRNIMEEDFNGEIVFSDHHLSHAASAFYLSPFEESAILTIDGVGEWATASIAKGDGNNIKMLAKLEYPDSLGLLYSAFTYYTGFRVNGGEYKLMGLAPYGNPIFVDKIKEKLLTIRSDGSLSLNQHYFGYLKEMKMTNSNFNKLFGGPPRKPEGKITQREMDLACSIQVVTEEVIIKMAHHVKQLTKSDNLCMAGGVALNCVANGKILKQKIFDNLWIQPASGDAGGSLGSAMAWYYKKFRKKREIISGKSIQGGSYWGPSFSNQEVLSYLKSNRLRWNNMYDFIEIPESERAKAVAKLLSEGKIVAHFSGRMEFGPRALGARSIIGSPLDVKTQSVMNLKIKYRESFRPFAPTVLEEDVNEYFNLDIPSPFMLLVSDVKKERCLDNSAKDDIFDWVNQKRSDIPAVTHVDYSARIQTINKEDNLRYYDIIKEFKEITGYGIVVNTSFNVRGEPIICTPHEAINCLLRTEIDVLAIENYLVSKNENYKKMEKQKHRRSKPISKSSKYMLIETRDLFNSFEKLKDEITPKINLERNNNRSTFWKDYTDSKLQNILPLEIDDYDEDQYADYLVSFWEKYGDREKAELKIILKNLIKLKNRYRYSESEDIDELDEDIYVMF